ncbi:hypothetical protein Ddye_013058 [Dipteronia dyeriana]|uniref:Reverse transcriptase domain-containing protein n=1 Tax=Dipteronia dyeriana TaxID=168575 RepID=A0AAE0CJ87_9ROSI|nr:hypothetical protein Ddye_013058 [Dipteronia dyeriana]
MSKAYDHVEWCFLEGMIRIMGFSNDWILKIMDCVSTVTYSFILNDKIIGNIKPSRGLRQGDPLSPYIFLLCVEGLLSLISRSKRCRELAGFRCRRRGPKITNLFFTDDSLLCTRASWEECANIRWILECYS